MTTDISVSRWDPSIGHGQEIIDEFEYDGGNSSSRLYERSRIKALADERENVQKKTFQKWVNSHLVRVGCRIGDLYVDMRDGKMLIRLLEVLSGERLPRPTKGKMRIHCLENVDKALQFLREQRVHLENMGSHDIVDGNPRLNLGLIWTIILRFQIQDITIEETDNKETKSAKDALLLWCQMKTAGYNNVNVRNFTTSWRDGLAFNAIIHKHRPDLVQFEKLHRNNPMHNLNNAFNVAEEKLGLTKLLDAEDIAVDHPDEKSIITYVVTYYHYFSKLKQETVQGKRIGKVVGIAMENDKMIMEYESLTSDLLQWIERTIEALGDRTFANSLEGVRQQLIQFANYRTVEKPPKFVEKGNLEVLLFTLQSRMRAANQRPYTPREGRMIHDINRAWERLEKAEHERELALREELIRQEKLEQLAARFNRKAQMRETWLSENQRLVSQDNFGFDLAAVEAAAKKHEAIETDIFAYEERVQAVVAVCSELQAERYHDIERVCARRDNVLRLWAYLLELLRARRARLELSLQLQQNFQEMLYILDSMEEIKMRLLTDDYGKHLMGVEDLLQKHALVEADINVLGERVKVVVGQSQRFLEQEEGGYRPLYLLISKHKALQADVSAHEAQLMSVAAVGDELVSQGHFGADRIQERLRDILSQWNHLLDVVALRKNRLDAAVRYHQLFADADDIDTWMLDTLRLVSSEDTGVDEAQVQSLLKKHKDVTDELKNYANVIQQLKQQASELSPEDASSAEVSARLAAIDARHGELAALARLRKQRLLDALSLFKLLAEADAADQWIAEKDRMLDTVLPPKDIDDVEIMKHRYDGFDKEMNANASRVAVVNQLARQLIHVEHPQAPRIQERQAALNHAWSTLREKAEAKKDELKAAQGVQTFHIECRETVSWIEDKKRILQQTDNLEMDLNGVMTLQRRLSGMERDLAAIQARIASLEAEASAIEGTHPEEAQLIRDRIAHINDNWEQLTHMLKERDSKLEEAGDLHRFLRSVDHFQAWLTKTQTDVASKDIPSSLSEAEKLLSQHQTIKEEIDNYKDEYAKMMEYGEKITAEPSTQDDPQYMFLRERLKALREGWAELQQMWENRQQLLAQSLELQLLQRDARQAEVLLAHQEHRLAKTEPPTNLEQAENMIKEHEAFLTTMEANDDKINSVVQFANRLVEERHFDADKIQRKAENIDARRSANREKALQQMEKLQDQLQLHQFLQDCDELGEWVQEKNLTAQDDTYRSAKTIHSKWTRHQAFEAEIAANKERLFAVQNAAEELMKQKPEFVEVISPKMHELQDQFENLQTSTKEKGERLFDANREVLLHQTCDDIDSWMNELEKQIENTDTGTDLTSVNILMQKQQMIETQMAVKAKQVTELETQAEYLQKTVPDKMEEIKEKKKTVEQRFEQLKAPLLERQRQLAKKKEAFQFRRDVEDEKLWIHEKMPLAMNSDFGHSLFNVQMLQKKNQSLKTETDNHEPRILTVISNGQKLIDEEHEASPEFKQLIDELTARWQELKDAIENRKNNLSQWEKAQQYLFDANEAEAWMSEQELYMMVEDRGKDEISAQNLMKKHEILEQAVDDYAQTIRQLGETVRQLTSEEHPLSEQISVKQSQVDKLYAGLKDLAGERRAKLDEALRLFQLSREVDDLEQWITERELVASSQELGQDYDHVTLLWERFKEFARETQAVGSERVATAERIADQMIAMGHSDNATIAQWKEGLKETWQDLLELIETRMPSVFVFNLAMLAASRELHKYFHDCKDTLQRVSEKARGVSDELGRDAISVGALQRKHHNFMQDLSTLQQQVEAISSECSRLGASYAGDKALEITRREAEVREAWAALQAACAARRAKLEDADDLYRFLSQVRTLALWMDDVVRQMNTGEKPRDVSGVELLMNNHQSLKAEIETREDNFAACISLGRELLGRQHYASADIKDKLQQLNNQRNALLRRWEERWENLQLILEVSDELGRDAISVGALQRKHHNFMQDLSTLQQQVEAISSECSRLGASYAGDKALEITRREAEVREAWAALQAACAARRAKLEDADDLYRFLSQVRTLALWMDDVVRQMNTGEKPRDVSGVELLMNNHQSLKAEIETREDNFAACISLGRELLGRQHYASADIKDKLQQLNNQRNALLRRWEERWENLQLILEVYQFARDAAVAEAWLIAQEPYLMSQELGHTIDEVESLIKKHEAFEKSAAAQEDRFSALQRLTTLELKGATLWPIARPWDKCDESTFLYQPPSISHKNTQQTLEVTPTNIRPVGDVVEDIIRNTGKYQISEKLKLKLHVNYQNNEASKNDSFLWSVVTNNSLSTISEISSPPMTPLKSPLSPEIYSSVFFEYPFTYEKPDIRLSCIDFILWERLSYQLVYPNVSLIRHNSTVSSKSGSIKRIISKISKKIRLSDDSDKSEIAVLSLPGLSSHSKTVNDLPREVKHIPLSSSLLLLFQTRKLLFPEGAWYYNYLDCFEVKEMKRRQEAAEAAERERVEREAAAAAEAARAELEAQQRASETVDAPQPHDASSPAPEPEAPPSPTSTPSPPPAQDLPRPSTSKPTPAKPARLSTGGSSSTPATPSTSGKTKTRSRSKSPFRSFRWRTAKKLLAGAHHSDDEEGASPAGEDEGFEGTLMRKHEWESGTKRASNRSWDKVYAVAKDGRMSFYKDQKSFRATPEQTWRGEPPLDLTGAVVEVAANYTKKKHVFRLRLGSGAEFLLQAHDEAEMSAWLGALSARLAAPTPRSHTLPAPSAEPKRRSFFTLKKKSVQTLTFFYSP
ncbi:Spectrin beta chain, brain 1 [Papilio machaon]|uniref:Spectrin beta chain, brain 1 n=1 Tax=Papilio machaon TaxID=76193 RepID=A0A0N1IGH6_PAPMA|nr:Spectrin beta chain, brain 1 [Papilio machaon]